MSLLNSAQPPTIEEQIQQAEIKYQQLLRQDAQFEVLKEIKRTIKILKKQLNHPPRQLNEN